MLFLLQIYKMIDRKDLFIQIFSDLNFEINELGYQDAPEELVNELLSNHFGLSIECENQLKMFTNSILKRNDLNFLKSF